MMNAIYLTLFVAARPVPVMVEAIDIFFRRYAHRIIDNIWIVRHLTYHENIDIHPYQ